MLDYFTQRQFSVTQEDAPNTSVGGERYAQISISCNDSPAWGSFVSVGLISLLDDIVAIAKVTAASLDDVASQAARAGVKAAGVVIDDAAVTPRYVIGFASSRELPIVAKIAMGSIRNKLLILLPAALALSYFVPWAITPLLMLGGAYLCYEGVEKIFEIIMPHRAHEHEAQLVSVALKPQTLEDEKVASAIKTDFILSAEIMAITLAALPNGGLLTQALVLALVGFGITLAVYGAVAVIVKADDAGVALAKNNRPNAVGGLSRVFGKAIVRGMPWFLTVLSVVGTAAMIWVGGGIVVHGLETHGFSEVDHVIAGLAAAVSGAVPWAAKTVEWIAIATLSGLFGLLIGTLLIPVVGFVVAPAWRVTKDYLNRSPKSA